MDNLKQAYEQLGLTEDASREAVEKRYMTLIRQAKARGNKNGTGDDFDFDAITRAYRFILDQDKQQAIEELTTTQYGKYKKLAGAAEKTDHFFHYYKFHVLGAILLLILVGYGVKSYMDNQAQKAAEALLPPIDVYVMYHGQFFLEHNDNNMAPIEAALLPQFPEWQRIKAGLTYVPKETRSELDMASIQKAVLAIMTEKADVYIFDKNTFAQLSAQGLLQPLDHAVEGVLEPLISPEQLMASRTEDDTEEHIYGIDLSNNQTLSGLAMYGDERIVGIRSASEHADNALLFIQRMLEKQ